jgi:mevalonate kinase
MKIILLFGWLQKFLGNRSCIDIEIVFLQSFFFFASKAKREFIEIEKNEQTVEPSELGVGWGES